MNTDPLRPPETDEEPWTVQPEPVTREWSRWTVVVCVASMVCIALYLGRNGS